MKVLHISNNYTPYSGGVVRSLQAILPALIKQGIKIKLATLDFGDPIEEKDPEWVIRIPCPIKFHYKTNPMAIPFRARAHLEEIYKTFKPDLVHVHHPFLLGWDAVNLAHDHDIPIIFTYHTLYESYAHYVPLPEKMVQPVIKKMVLSFCAEVDGIVAPSTFVRSMLRSAQIKTKIKIIPSPIAPDFAALIGQEKKERLPEKSCKLLVVSRFAKEKNLPFILNMFAQLPLGYTLTMVGFGPEYDAIKELAYDTLELSKQRVRFIHKPSRKDLIEQYKNADIFLFSSKTDTQGLVLAEAMAAGLPVIALDGPGQRDIIKNNYNGYLVQTGLQMRKSLNHLYAKPDIRIQFSHNSKKTAKKFTINEIIQNLISFYQELVNQ